MFYTIKLTNLLFRQSIFPYLMHRQKVFKTLDFWFIDTWNNIDQLQWSGSCNRMSDVCIWGEKILPQIFLEGHMSIFRDKLVSFQKDLSPDPSNSNSTLRHANTRSTLLKLIYIISSLYKPKIKCFEYFVPIHQVAQNGRPKVVSWFDLCLWTYKFLIRPFDYDLNI